MLTIQWRISNLRKRIRATPCFIYFLFVDFNLGKIDFKTRKNRLYSVPSLKLIWSRLKSIFPSLKSICPSLKSIWSRLKSICPSLKSIFPSLKSILSRLKSIFPSLKSIFPRLKSIFPRLKSTNRKKHGVARIRFRTNQQFRSNIFHGILLGSRIN